MSAGQFFLVMIPALGLFALAWFVVDGIASVLLAVMAFVGFWATVAYLKWRFENTNPS